MSDEILKEFQIESKNLIGQMLRILENCEDDFSQVQRLEDFGQTVDRIMGGAKSLALVVTEKDHIIHKIGDYSALCKAVGYKASQIKGNPQFYDICIAFLLDATEMLSEMFEKHFDSKTNFKELFSKTFLDRLKWLSDQFGEEFKATLDIHKTKQQKMSQEEIDQLLKKLGLD
jgi:hypothetical protein